LMVTILDASDDKGQFVGPALSPDPAALPPTTQRPGWCEGLISAGALWSTPASAQSVAAVAPLFATYTSWLDAELGSSAGPVLAPEAATARVRYFARLCEHFRQHEPSRPFLRTAFGEAWAEQYITSFLFPDLWANCIDAMRTP